LAGAFFPLTGLPELPKQITGNLEPPKPGPVTVPPELAAHLQKLPEELRQQYMAKFMRHKHLLQQQQQQQQQQKPETLVASSSQQFNTGA
jgi:hypothetical protein